MDVFLHQQVMHLFFSISPSVPFFALLLTEVVQLSFIIIIFEDLFLELSYET